MLEALEFHRRRIYTALGVSSELLGVPVKLLIRDPIPLDKLLERLRLVNLHVSAERHEWLRQHHEHEGLQLEKDRFYCRTCQTVG